MIIIPLFLLYRYMTKQFGKWESMNVPCLPGSFPAGSNPELINASKHISQITLENYQKFKDQDYFGIYMLGKPVLTITNPETIRSVMVKEFNCFVDRTSQFLNGSMDGGDMDQFWMKQLTALGGDEWKDVRSTFSPIFTSGKMRGMLKFINIVGESLCQELDKQAQTGEDFELRTLFGKFSLDSIASCGFGLNPDSFNDKDSVFVKSAASIFVNSSMDQLKMMSRLIPGMVWLQKCFGINLMKPKATRFMVNTIKKTIKHRRETGVRQNDMIDLMIDCMKDEAAAETEGGSDQYDADMKMEHKRGRQLDEDIIVATSMVLLVAGYDTTGITLTWMFYELARNPEVQTKLQEEIDAALEDTDGKLPDYNVIQELPYLEMCIMETLRINNPVGTLTRNCNQDVQLPNVPFKTRVDDLLVIPVIGIHMDEKNYPNPTEFNPLNFTKEARQSRSPYTFLAFGQGPRACIGMRFAMLEIKVAMIEILSKFTLLPSDKNPETFTMDPEHEMGYPKSGVFGRVARRE